MMQMLPELPGEDNYTPFDPDIPFKNIPEKNKLLNNVFPYIFHRLVSSNATCLRHMRPSPSTGVTSWGDRKVPATGRRDGSDGHYILSPELPATISAWIAMAPWHRDTLNLT